MPELRQTENYIHKLRQVEPATRSSHPGRPQERIHMQVPGAEQHVSAHRFRRKLAPPGWEAIFRGIAAPGSGAVLSVGQLAALNLHPLGAWK